LRPGTITPSQIKTATGIEVVADHHQHSQSPRVSGSHQAHYAPYTPLHLYCEGDIAQQITEQSKRSSKKMVLIVWHDCFDLYRKNFANVSAQLELSAVENNPKQLGQMLYRLLRDLDQKNFGAIFIPNPPPGEPWDAVRDRLQRASFGSGPSSNNQVNS
jgi:L-threonylcarbamoyladenylate synthase